jgi:hypothetical protein
MCLIDTTVASSDERLAMTDKIVRPRFNLRLDPELHHALTTEARRELRSLNAEIQYRLRQSLAQRPEQLVPAEQ